MPVNAEQSRLAAFMRWRKPDDPELIDAQLAYRYSRLKEHIRATVDAAPPLTEAQRMRLASLLLDTTPGTTTGSDRAAA